jgi:hypothetical protein
VAMLNASQLARKLIFGSWNIQQQQQTERHCEYFGSLSNDFKLT